MKTSSLWCLTAPETIIQELAGAEAPPLAFDCGCWLKDPRLVAEPGLGLKGTGFSPSVTVSR